MNQSSFQQKKRGSALSSASTPSPRNKGQYNSHNSQHFKARPAQSKGSVAQESNQAVVCAKYGITYPDKFHDCSIGCLKCGKEGHFMKECFYNSQGNGNHGNRVKSSSVCPLDRVVRRGDTFDTSKD